VIGASAFLAGLWCSLSVRKSYFHLPQQRYDLLRFVFLHRHVQLSFSMIFSTLAGLIQASYVSSTFGPATIGLPDYRSTGKGLPFALDQASHSLLSIYYTPNLHRRNSALKHRRVQAPEI
jgi:hypothetical protein